MKNTILILFFGYMIGSFIHAKYPSAYEYWYTDEKTLHRGDKVKLILPEPQKSFYEDCDATYLAGQAVDEDNLTWVLLKNCHFQEKYGLPRLVTDVFSRKYVEKIK